MAMAATKTLVQVNEMVELGELDPENVITPGIFVNALIEVSQPQQESQLVKDGIVYPATKSPATTGIEEVNVGETRA